MALIRLCYASRASGGDAKQALFWRAGPRTGTGRKFPGMENRALSVCAVWSPVVSRIYRGREVLRFSGDEGFGALDTSPKSFGYGG